MKDGEDMTDTGFFDDSTVVGELRLTGDKVYPYEVRVSNSYTGVSRIVCAGTRWELETLLESEKKRQRSEEVIKRAMSISPDERSAARIMTENTQGIFDDICATFVISIVMSSTCEPILAAATAASQPA